jgi:hypothetical protein
MCPSWLNLLVKSVDQLSVQEVLEKTFVLAMARRH